MFTLHVHVRSSTYNRQKREKDKKTKTRIRAIRVLKKGRQHANDFRTKVTHLEF